MNPNGFGNPFPLAGYAGGNSEAAFNANGQAYNMPGSSGGGGGGGFSEIARVQGIRGIYSFLGAGGQSLGKAAALNAAYAAWAAQQAMLGQQWAAGGGSGSANGSGAQSMNAGVSSANVGYNPAGQAGMEEFGNQPPHAGGMGGVNAMIGGGVMGTNSLGEPTMNARFNGAHGINGWHSRSRR